MGMGMGMYLPKTPSRIGDELLMIDRQMKSFAPMCCAVVFWKSCEIEWFGLIFT